MAVIHISEAEAGPGVKALIDHVREGDTVRIGSGSESFEVVRSTLVSQPRLLSEVLAALKLRDTRPTGDLGFADDIEEGILRHQGEPRFDPWE